jgi:hypothetical protein
MQTKLRQGDEVAIQPPAGQNLDPVEAKHFRGLDSPAHPLASDRRC